MDGWEFENYLASLFSVLGYHVTLTPATGDFGGDLILKRDGEQILVQAKRWNSVVGVPAVQEAYTAKSYYKCDRCVVVTNNFFTKSARQLAEPIKVALWDRNDLRTAIADARSVQQHHGIVKGGITHRIKKLAGHKANWK